MRSAANEVGTLAMAGAVALAVALGACADRTSLTASHGRAYGAALARQASDPNAGARARPIAGLDSQDAAVIAKSYRKGMAGKEGTAAEQPTVVMSTKATTPGGYYVPPPSVPEGGR